MGNWYGDTSDKIIGISHSETPPEWKSSTPLPENQLTDLGKRGPFVDGYRDYNYDEKLAELVEGKSLAFVCPSPSLQGEKKGEFIDSHDLVVRVNQAFSMEEDMWEDYGKRSDILMNCVNINKIHAIHNNMDYFKSLKYIICPMVSMWDVERANDVLAEPGVPWHNVCDGYLFKTFREVGTTCNSGLMGIITLMNYNVKSIYVAGMTFFNMNTFGKVYFDKYHDEAVKYNNFRDTPDKSPTQSDLRMDIHHQVSQIQYFKKMYDKYNGNQLICDEYLEDNFNNESYTFGVHNE